LSAQLKSPVLSQESIPQSKIRHFWHFEHTQLITISEEGGGDVLVSRKRQVLFSSSGFSCQR
jgi:hypothetical protein